MVEWEDSHGDGAWQQLDVDLEDRALVCRSVGWLMLDGERAKVVAPHMSQQEPGVPLQGCGIMTIPASAVLRVVSFTDPPGAELIATYTFWPSIVVAMLLGRAVRGPTLSITRSVLVSTTSTIASASLGTYIRLPSGATTNSVRHLHVRDLRNDAVGHRIDDVGAITGSVGLDDPLLQLLAEL